MRAALQILVFVTGVVMALGCGMVSVLSAIGVKHPLRWEPYNLIPIGGLLGFVAGILLMGWAMHSPGGLNR